MTYATTQSKQSVTIDNASTINVFTPEAIGLLLKEAEIKGYQRCREEDEVVSRKDVSEMFQVHVRTIDRWIENGEIPRPKQVGEKSYWTKSQLIDFIRLNQ